MHIYKCQYKCQTQCTGTIIIGGPGCIVMWHREGGLENYSHINIDCSRVPFLGMRNITAR